MSHYGEQKKIVIAGGGPAGLRAAEVAARQGAKVLVLEAKRYVGRKFLVAGKSGLNLTNAEPLDLFIERYTGPRSRWQEILGRFSNEDLRAWSESLGFPTFVSSGKKVFPDPMKAGPLLRAWIERLRKLGVELQFNSRISELAPQHVTLESGETISFDALILAFGGASWPSTGSDGGWPSMLARHNIQIAPFQAANCGWEIDWPEAIVTEAEGKPLKNVVVSHAGQSKPGELTITKYGIEGGPIYHLGPVLRASQMPTIEIDLKPNLSLSEVENRLRAVKKNYIRESKRRLKLSDTAASLLKHLPNLGPWKDTATLAKAIKSCPIQLKGPRPIEEAISTAGGVSWEELDENLMLHKLPGVFIAGEMIDWEAPTGGYLLQGCFATGQVAAEGALSLMK